MLSYIYIGKVQNLERNATQLLKTADIYQLDNLKGRDYCVVVLFLKLYLEHFLFKRMQSKVFIYILDSDLIFGIRLILIYLTLNAYLLNLPY